jgi:ribonuclease BN (tRNA processing enzyme)
VTLTLHVLGCSPAWPNPGEACSSYLVEAGDQRIVLDLGTGALAQLLLADRAPVGSYVLSHLHWDHIADLVPLTYGLRYGWYSDWPRPALHTPPDGREHLRRLAEVAIGKAEFFEEAFAVSDYDPAAGLTLGDVRLTFRAMRHPGVSYAIRVERGGASLCYSGDTGPTPALAEHARGVDLFLCEAGMGDADSGSEEHHLAVESARAAADAGARRLVLTHVEAHRRPGALRLAAGAFDGPVELAAPGLRATLP